MKLYKNGELVMNDPTPDEVRILLKELGVLAMTSATWPESLPDWNRMLEASGVVLSVGE